MCCWILSEGEKVDSRQLKVEERPKQPGIMPPRRLESLDPFRHEPESSIDDSYRIPSG